MLVKVTNQCAMRCGHCMEDSRPRTGQHMTLDTFVAALDCVRRVEVLARQALGYRLVLLSGGECTEHPQFLEMLDLVHDAQLVPVIITNGMWLNDPYLAGHILRPDRKVLIQVTNDPRFYPEAPPHVTRDPRLVNVPELSAILPLGRATRLKDLKGLRPQVAPGSFNFRSMVRGTGDIRAAVLGLRQRALAGKSNGHCTPSIDHEGYFHAGESRLCAKVGTVHSSIEELTHGVLNMGECNNCGLEANLDERHREAIGLGRKRA